MSNIKNNILDAREFIQDTLISYFALLGIVLQDNEVIYTIMDLNTGESYKVKETMPNGIDSKISKWLSEILEDNLIFYRYSGSKYKTTYKTVTNPTFLKNEFPLYFNGWINENISVDNLDGWSNNELSVNEIKIIPNYDLRAKFGLINAVYDVSGALYKMIE